ncbi:Receptor-type guanylate cyclase gcy [Seminavis robusta]|uniref:Receptor-type guanylate cyclase gcy n=1 Tax=Seminavis robusta TaxID=568900 RepID=A0A9N8DRU4_9STRA|nr:Receptor-type guanylate cyclase gcy [Seminavis robusta]|eukprot:Sro310_g114030.1 Receptor-type guanylate cyclase gcy (1207) ;mRNA; r:26602-31694
MTDLSKAPELDPEMGSDPPEPVEVMEDEPAEDAAKDYSESSGQVNSSVESTGGFPSGNDDEEDDEVEHARQVAKSETARLRFWRFVVTDTIIMIAVVLIISTYCVQREEEHVQFAEAWARFASSVGDRVVEQQQTLRSSLLEFSTVVSTTAELVYNPWPFFTLPRFEAHAQRTMAVAGVQALGLFSMVHKELRQEWVDFADKTHEDVVLTNNKLAGTQDDLKPVGYNSFISRVDSATGGMVQDFGRESYFPSLAWSPPPLDFATINWNMGSDAGFYHTIEALVELGQDEVLFTFPDQVDPLYQPPNATEEPMTYAFAPVYQEPQGSSTESPQFVGVISSAFTWDHMFANTLPQDVHGMVAVLESANCNQVFSYEINGRDVTYLGAQDVHDTDFDKYIVNVDLGTGFYQDKDMAMNTTGHCTFTLNLYPSATIWDQFVSFRPEAYAIVVSMLFFCIAAVYFVYDQLVDGRNEKLIARFARSNAIVSSLFPKNIQARLLGDGDTSSVGGKSYRSGSSLKAFMSSGGTGDHGNGASKPLADLFPDVSILFADLVGFTAWSSVREPNQVFILLETIYSSFDEVAEARRIFKVETVGDCYVAASGLPNPRNDHAVAMVRFASDINIKIGVLAKELEVVLGPDTGDLALRIGIHSGPVTAGILRGKKARFQLFGDTMNTTSRLETTGMAGRIHISQATVDLLARAGKSHWVHKRKDLVAAKGKGVIQTYWVTPAHGHDGESTTSGSSFDSGVEANSQGDKGAKRALPRSSPLANHSSRVDRLVEWNVGALLHLLKEIIARRDAQNEVAAMMPAGREEAPLELPITSGGKPLDEVKDIVELPEFNRAAARRQRNPEQMEIPSLVVDQLRNLVRRIAGGYRSNYFHNFEHASHVTMSVTKLLSRIVAPTDLDMDDISESDDQGGAAASLHDHTFGITSDPLTQFACIFSALIHDVDHTGVPNTQLVKEKGEIAAYYNNRSVAEQNSFDLSWAIFMESSFDAFRAALCSTPTELRHFREIAVTCVMATDIADKDLKASRNARWQKAFDAKPADSKADLSLGRSSTRELVRSTANRKATVVIEHLLQASDVAHTMQHWHIYRKWNERFFLECYKAHLEGRSASDPREYWFKGEIGFFDFYIIPLCKKLKECGVFGVSSDEYLIYAQNNRDEWATRGKDIVADFIAKAEREFGETSFSSSTPANTTRSDSGGASSSS